MEAKACTKCGEVKPRGSFSPAAEGRHGLTSRCKACAAALMRARREANPRPRKVKPPPPYSKPCRKCGVVSPNTLEHFYRLHRTGAPSSVCLACERSRDAKAQRARRRESPEAREKNRAAAAAYAAKHREALRENQRQYRREHAAELSERRKLRAADPEIRERRQRQQREWAANNPDKRSTYSARRQAKTAPQREAAKAVAKEARGAALAAKYEQPRPCPRCGDVLPNTAEFFSRARSTRRGLTSYCKACVAACRLARDPELERASKRASEARLKDDPEWRARRAEYLARTAALRKARNRIYWHANRERILAAQREWVKRNHAKVRVSMRAALKRYYKRNPRARLDKTIRSRVSLTLKRRGGSRQGRDLDDLLPYTIDELARHLERQFQRGMTWENYGPTWHVDHIIPLSSFVFDSPDDPEFRAAWALSNLQPLWADENLAKRARRLTLL